jgi:hypothetical protein
MEKLEKSNIKQLKQFIQEIKTKGSIARKAPTLGRASKTNVQEIKIPTQWKC